MIPMYRRLYRALVIQGHRKDLASLLRERVLEMKIGTPAELLAAESSMMGFIRSVTKAKPLGASSTTQGGREKYRLDEFGELQYMDGSWVGRDNQDDDARMQVSDADMKRHTDLLRRQHFMDRK